MKTKSRIHRAKLSWLKSHSIFAYASLLTIVFFWACGPTRWKPVNTDFSKINGSFELLNKNGNPQGWYLWQSDKANDFYKKELRDFNYLISLDTTEFVDGRNSIKFDVKKCKGKRCPFGPGIFDEFDVNPGEVYEINFWVKNVSASYVAEVSLVNEMGHGDSYQPSLIESSDHSKEWKKITIIRSVEPKWRRLRVMFDVTNEGVVYLDNITIKRIK